MRVGERRQGGFTLIAVLVAMVLMALALQAVMTVVSQQAQREREMQLQRVGNAIADAIGSYYRSSPGSVKNWPQSLEDLTQDRRFVDARRHLREVYADPITRTTRWGIVRGADGGIAGVFSESTDTPLRDVQHYSDWKFSFNPDDAGRGQ
jgi:type II secretory pathway pseudopilin PulG